MLGSCYEKKFDGGCIGDLGSLRSDYKGLSVETCYQKCAENSLCREFKIGKIGQQYEGESFLYGSDCVQETQWDLTKKVEMYKMTCSIGGYLILSNMRPHQIIVAQINP